MEQWKDITGWEGRYQISTEGRVKSIRGGKVRPQTVKILKPGYDMYGYHHVNLGPKQKARLHRLVAEAFIPNPEGYPAVCHKNDVPDDNRVENLYWGTFKHNAQDREGRGRSKRINLTSLLVERASQGIPHPRLGMRHTEETKQKISRANKRKPA